MELEIERPRASALVIGLGAVERRGKNSADPTRLQLEAC